MHLAHRAYVLAVLTAVLAIAGTWSGDPALAGAWRWPAAALLLGLAIEGYFLRRTRILADVEVAPRILLGREAPAAFVFGNDSPRDVTLEYGPVVPPGFEPLGEARRATVPRRGTGRDPVVLAAVRLGPQVWPALPARLLGRFALAWWSRELPVSRAVAIAPDTLRTAQGRAAGNTGGMRSRRTAGAGSELHQLRGYLPGDPPSRIDWKATARMGRLVSREFSEDQHLDILLAIDAGRLSRIRAGRLDRLGLYANIAARFAEGATPSDDRVGLLVFSDRPLVVCAPDRGLAAVARIRRALERLEAAPAESDPVAAAVRARGLLRHRGLVVLLTDLDDPSGAEPLVRAVRLLSPPHLVVVAGVHGTEIAELARREARGWRDPWVALAAQEHEARARRQHERLRRLGAPVVATREDRLEAAVFAEYERLRARRVA